MFSSFIICLAFAEMYRVLTAIMHSYYAFPNSATIPFNEMTSLKAFASAVYLASAVDKAITLCNVAIQLIVQPPIVNK